MIIAVMRNERTVIDVRLIDADKMKADLLTVDPKYETMIQWCITILDAQPTIEPERKTGKWITESFEDDFTVAYSLKCSECGKYYGWKHNFCPNCGAKMEGDSDDS